MKVATIILLSIFGVISLIHLVFCYFEKEKARKITKVFCMVALGAAAIVQKPDAPLIYVGAFLSAIGDFFLLEPKNIKRFVAGTICFLAGHVCYFTQFAIYATPNMPVWGFVLIAVGLISAGFILFPITYKIAREKLVAYLGGVYMTNLAFMVLCGIHLIIFLANHGHSPLPGILLCAGYVAFLVSDSLLTQTTYVKDIKRRDFPIMLTYLIGEACIVIALLLV